MAKFTSSHGLHLFHYTDEGENPQHEIVFSYDRELTGNKEAKVYSAELDDKLAAKLEALDPDFLDQYDVRDEDEAKLASKARRKAPAAKTAAAK
jgi:hypothetical protein